VLGASFQVLRRNPRPTFGFALLVTGVTFVFALLVVGVVTGLVFARVANASQADVDELMAGSVGIVILVSLVPIALALAAAAALQGIISLEVARGTLGEKNRLRGLWRAARGRLGALIGWTFLIVLAFIVGIAIIAGLIAMIAVFGGTAGIIVGVLLGILLGLGAAVLVAWLSTKLSLVPSVLMLERLPLRAAIARSWSLTTGHFWRVLGTLLLVSVILQVVTSIITTPLSFAVTFGSTLVNPNGDNTGLIITGVVLYVLTIIVSVVFGAITSVVQSATPALLYIDLRMRKEGLDLELIRFVEARQAGDTTVSDPFLVKAGDATTTQTGSSPWS
jgi:membrane-anchored glycerophosphoryl diester phosphodiesterase (GDPDase)